MACLCVTQFTETGSLHIEIMPDVMLLGAYRPTGGIQ